MSAVRAGTQPTVARIWLPRMHVRAADLLRVAAPVIALVTAVSALGVGLLAVPLTTADDWTMPAIAMLAVGLLILAIHSYKRTSVLDPVPVVLLGACLIAAAVLGGLPPFLAALRFHAVFHRSVADAVLLLVLAVPGAGSALKYAFGATPHATDIARYPLLVTPVVLALGTYLMLIAMLLTRGYAQLSTPLKDGTPGWIVLVRQFQTRVQPPAVPQAGLLFNLIGTLELVALTLIVAVPIGVGIGLFVSEVAPGPLGRFVRFCTTALRGVSVVLLALAGASLVAASRGTQLERFIGGYFFDAGGIERIGPTFSRGSYIPAAIVTALLVIPVVARATEEGCRSLPMGIREGSAALGATQDYMLIRLVIPWALPNIFTAVLLGAAETAGGVSTLLFLAGSGEQGVSPFNEVTNLAFSVFWTQFSPFKPFRDLQQPFGFAAAGLLLVIALMFTFMSLSIKSRYASRYRGG